MPRWAYVNGRYVRHRDAAVHVEDRGYQFADGVYEVCQVVGGRPVDERRHLDRLERSLAEIEIDMPMSRAAFSAIQRELIRRNRIRDGLVYMQVTRGVAPRDHVFPSASVRPALVMTAKSIDMGVGERIAKSGIAVITVPENRWPRVDIKSVGLLPNVLAREEAKRAGAREAWFVDRDGYVTEGAATNAWIVTMDGVIVTRPAEFGILRGITRTVVLEVAERLGLRVEERAFTPDEAKAAREAFITAATQIVMPVVKIDGETVANGEPGSVATELRKHFFDVAEISIF